MQKIKNKFIIFIILIIIGIIGYGIFNSYFDKKNNRLSNVVLVNGKATLNNSLLELNKKEELFIGDTVRTIGKDALAVLEWGDGSVTRLGGNTRVKIEELYVSGNLNKINISFILLSGKSWSNVISFLGEESYFKEYFRDSEAAVRGTIFNVDLTKDYLYVIDHKVKLTTGEGKIIVVNEKKPLNLSNFNFIALEDFLKGFKDKTWEKLNNGIDKEFFAGLKQKINNDLDKLVDLNSIDIDKVLLNENERMELYNDLLSDYQKFNFINVDDTEFFKKKLELKEKLIQLAERKDKEILIKNTLYDIKNILDSKDYKNLDFTLSILSKNTELLQNVDLNEYFDMDIMGEDVKRIFKEKFNDIKGLFGKTFNNVKNINIKTIEEKTTGVINQGLDTLLENIKK